MTAYRENAIMKELPQKINVREIIDRDRSEKNRNIELRAQEVFEYITNALSQSISGLRGPKIHAKFTVNNEDLANAVWSNVIEMLHRCDLLNYDDRPLTKEFIADRLSLRPSSQCSVDWYITFDLSHREPKTIPSYR